MRLLPVLMILLSLSFALRIYDISTQSSLLVSGSLAESKPAEKAEEKKEPEATAAEEKKDEAHEDTAADPHAASAEKPKEPKKDKDAPPYSTTRPEVIPPRGVNDNPLDSNAAMIEKDLLKNLSRRREELDEEDKALALRESIIKATEMRIDSKISEMRDLKKQVEDKLAEYQKKDEEQIMSLVKIYENMKPKEAARIFEEIDMKVLLQVINHMNEKKVAPILANMSPNRAKEITVEIAKQKKLPTPEDFSKNAEPSIGSPTTPPASLPEQPSN